MAGFIGKKVGMTSYFDEETGKVIPCTLVQAGPCTVTQVKKEETDGYKAIQLGFDDVKEKSVSQPLNGHFRRANVTPKRKLAEFDTFDEEHDLGKELKFDEFFSEGQFIDVTGFSKGKGFQGVVKRHGFSGVGETTHGQHDRQRAPGSIGGASDPSRVFKGKKMAGRTGNNRVKVENLRIVKIYAQENLVLLSGSVPGANNGYLIIER